MSDNRDFSRLATNPSSTDAVNAFNDLASEADGALSASLPVPVTDTNTVTITRAQLKSVMRIVLQEGSPVTTDTITVFVNNDNSESPAVGVPLGRFTVINETANSARFYLVGGSSPSGTDLIAAGVGTAGGDAAALIDVLADDVVSVGGGSGGGGAAAPVDSVFGRTGVVVAESGDYNATQVSFTDPIAGSPPLDNVDEALVYCLNNLGGGGGGGVQEPDSTGADGVELSWTWQVTLEDDEVFQITVGSGVELRNISIMFSTSTNASGKSGALFVVRPASTGQFSALIAGVATEWTGGTGALAAGATGGTDGDMNVNVTTDNIYIKNRFGFAVEIGITLMQAKLDPSGFTTQKLI